MPTPIFNFRLDAVKADELRQLSRLYGSPTPSHFLREMVGAMISGDPAIVAQFNARLFQKMGEQLALDFTAKAETAARETLKARTTLRSVTLRKKRRARNARTARP